ncbi:MAG TPA: hypothetical protein VM925_26840 [Labilithrix sp.]|nr:hypothetical protein [Labilithrix sp.]
MNARLLCERAIQLVAVPHGNVTITTDFPARDLIFEGDAQRLEQVLLNLFETRSKP